MSHTKSTEHLSKTVRRLYGKFTPRKRAEHEVGPVQVCNASVRETYRTGAGETSQPVRAGAMAAIVLLVMNQSKLDDRIADAAIAKENGK